MSDLIERAALIAAVAHGATGQRRKYTGEPYAVHTTAVAAMVATVPGVRPEVVAAAHLHDVLEDTQLDYELLRTLIGDDVAELVNEVTDVSTPGDGNRAARGSGSV